jgi:hypothetical protein
MQDFSVESKTFGISSLSTSWQDLEARYKSSDEVNMTPRSPRTKPEKMENSEDPVRKLPNLAGQGASSNSKRNWRQGPTCSWGKSLEDSGSNTGQRRPRAGPKWAQAGRPSPLRGLVGPLCPSRHSGYLEPRGQGPCINSFTIRHRGAEKRGTPSRRVEGRASWLGSP